MTNMIEKARANRVRALRLHALRTASISNMFGPVPVIESTLEPVEHVRGAAAARRKANRAMPHFISTRQISTPFAA